MPLLRGLLKFIKITLIVLAIPAGILVIMWVAFIANSYWYPTVSHGTPDEADAISIALGWRDRPPSTPSCNWDNPNPHQERCTWLREQTRRHCRWWVFERCLPYLFSESLLEDSTKLGKVVHAIIDPCLYYTQQFKTDPYPWRPLSCSGFHGTIWRNSTVLLVKGKNRTVTIRIDSPPRLRDYPVLEQTTEEKKP